MVMRTNTTSVRDEGFVIVTSAGSATVSVALRLTLPETTVVERPQLAAAILYKTALKLKDVLDRLD